MGFFIKGNFDSVSRPKGKVLSCYKCGYYRTSQNPKIEPQGNYNSDILNIAVAPSRDSDLSGSIYSKDFNNLLEKYFRKFNLDLYEDALNSCSVRCLPLDKEGLITAPPGLNIECCRSKLINTIKKQKPKVIIAYGLEALKGLVGHLFSGSRADIGKSIDKWRGFCIPDRTHNAWICPVYPPKFLLDKNGKDKQMKVKRLLFRQDLKQAIGLVNVPIEHIDEKQIVKCISSETAIRVMLKLLRRTDNFLLSFDYETTGLKPYDDGHNIICVSFTYRNKQGCIKCYSFPVDMENKIFCKTYKKVMLAKNIEKTAHNIKYEDKWTYKFFRIRPQSWKIDTMLASHISDNRSAITSLKIQVYINFGVLGYDKGVHSYIKGTKGADNKKSTNDKNTLLDYFNQGGKEEVLLYCGLDSLFGYLLAEMYIKELGLSEC